MDEKEHEIFSEPFLLRRPLLQAITQESQSPVLLVDECDRSDEEFEAFMLEVFSDWQVTIPEIGTIKATHPPHVILTSNRTRELSDALRRRCLDRKSTRLNSSHTVISYAVFCLKKKKR